MTRRLIARIKKPAKSAANSPRAAKIGILLFYALDWTVNGVNYFLCGQTGSVNRGCEAIVRSTVKLLPARRENVWLATFAGDQDGRMADELGINMIPYAPYPTVFHKYVCGLTKKLWKYSTAGFKWVERPIFDRLSAGDVCLNIGGDTYCYNVPRSSLALNSFTSRNGIKNILWCCSVEKEKMTDRIVEDLRRYTYIFAREQLTVRNLLSKGIPEEKIVKCCDPAFFLDPRETALPSGFEPGNTVGVNLSGLVINETNPYAYKNVLNVIRYILDRTGMRVCLIPHVYYGAGNRRNDDYTVLKGLYDELDRPGVSIVDGDLTCEELKYIISKCRFFIGARTHSTIAAYSSHVPTAVIGYSVKSRGIATDLFGTDEGFVLPYTELTAKDELTASFKMLTDNETAIKERYGAFLPVYKKQLTDAIKKYLPANLPGDEQNAV